MERAIINVVPFEQRNGVVVAIIEGVHCYFDRASVIPEPNIPVDVMVCSATNPVDNRKDSRHGYIRSLIIKTISDEDVLLQHKGFRWNEEQSWWQTELVDSPLKVCSLFPVEGRQWVHKGRDGATSTRTILRAA